MKDKRVTVSTEGTVLVAESLDELHRFATGIGLTLKDFVDHRPFPHYRLGTSTRRNSALDAGAHLRTRDQTYAMARRSSLGRKR